MGMDGQTGWCARVPHFCISGDKQITEVAVGFLPVVVALQAQNGGLTCASISESIKALLAWYFSRYEQVLALLLFTTWEAVC